LEERRHTRFLADLLDPGGSHDQGDLFLREFLGLLQGKSYLPKAKDSSSRLVWNVDTEKGIKDGIVDILIACPLKGYLIVIENKILARDPEDQLPRYHAWLESQARYYDKRLLVFLTPTGRPSASHKACPYVRLSYRADVVEILQKAIAKVEAPRVLAAVQEYLEVIQTLPDDGVPFDED